jgi:nicotinamide riboside kinase
MAGLAAAAGGAGRAAIGVSDPGASRRSAPDARAGRGRVIAIVGAESTGKSVLAQALAGALVRAQHDAVAVDEVLRAFCDAAGRTPRRDEQRAIAEEQAVRIDAAAARHAIVVADTTPLMIAVYSDLVFADTSLYAHAEQRQRGYDLTLLTALDLPWQADGLMRDGAHVRAPVDARLRAALARANVEPALVSGQADARLASALAAVRRSLAPRRTGAAGGWVCAECGDPACERHLLAGLRPAP